MMFVDANVFVYAFLKPSRKLDDDAIEIKERAKKIIQRIEEGERAATSLVHVSEVANVLEAGMNLARLSELLKTILGKENMLVLEPTRDDYLLALDLAPEEGVGPNDALAIVLMSRNDIHEIYSFDKHFDDIEGIKRIVS